MVLCGLTTMHTPMHEHGMSAPLPPWGGGVYGKHRGVRGTHALTGTTTVMQRQRYNRCCRAVPYEAFAFKVVWRHVFFWELSDL